MRLQKGRTMKTNEVDFSCLSLRNLRAMLPNTKGVEHPSETWFRENPNEIMFQDFCADGKITVYTNGFYTYTEDGGEHLSILRVDGFSRLRYDFADKTCGIVEEADYLDSSFLVALYVNGKNQWDRNAMKRAAYRHGYYLENDSSDWGEEAMVPSAEEECITTEEKKEQRAIIRRVFSTLTKRQKEIVRLHFMNGVSQTEIANRLGIAQPYVYRVLSRCVEIFQKNLCAEMV
jgi:RNA polymerase sigma factor (sigma-70 family)